MNQGRETDPLRIRLIEARNELSFLHSDAAQGGPDHETELADLRALVHRLEAEIKARKPSC
ncbi:MAG: hypothetical protein WBQ34_10170 [Candidatus Acidiferrales bacterium]|jgi:hypothetical protein